ncbi:MAG TPA: S-adenosylmethionine decarboxylase [Blastocatellia bacterium]|nr:S-adenosylmethionine decarboxylase [Blastocatellia bacterium]
MSVGTEWLVDAEGCSAELLRDVETIRRVCDQIISDLDLRVVGEGRWHEFPHPGGVTGLFLLTESHLACHTYPELGVATFNLYCCKHRPDWLWEKQLTAALCASVVTVRVAQRGASAGRGDDSYLADAQKRVTFAQGVRKR